MGFVSNYCHNSGVNMLWMTSGPLFLMCCHLWRELQRARARTGELERLLTIDGQRDGPNLPRACQLNPHFLFNALNTIRYYVRTNAATARDQLLDLSLVLQAAMRRESRVVLREELDSARAYLRLEVARLGPRLEVIDGIADEQTDLLVPSMVLGPLLQALVNAVASKNEGGILRLHMDGRVMILEADGRAALPPGLVQHLHASLSVSLDSNTRIAWRIPS